MRDAETLALAAALDRLRRRRLRWWLRVDEQSRWLAEHERAGVAFRGAPRVVLTASARPASTPMRAPGWPKELEPTSRDEPSVELASPSATITPTSARDNVLRSTDQRRGPRGVAEAAASDPRVLRVAGGLPQPSCIRIAVEEPASPLQILRAM